MKDMKENLRKMKNKVLWEQQLEKMTSDKTISPDDMLAILRKSENDDVDIDDLLKDYVMKSKQKELEEILARYNEYKSMLALAPNNADIKEEVEFWKNVLLKEFGFGE